MWEAERIDGRQAGGRTRPLIVSCVQRDDDGQITGTQDMLLKALGLPEVTDTGLFAEYFGSQLAIEFGIDAPRSYVVHLDEALIVASAQRLKEWSLAPRPGRAVGLEFLRGIAPISRAVIVKQPDEIQDAARVYAFDMLIQNPDRREEKPNCGNFRGKLLAFDHEMAFSFLYPLIGISDPWVIPPVLARQHVFYRGLSAAAVGDGRIDWGGILDALRAVDDRVEELVGFLPVDWRVHGDRVVAHIRTVRNHAVEFERAIRESLT